MRQQLFEKEDAIKVMSMEIDELEQTNRRHNLRIVEIPEEEDDDLAGKIIDLTGA